MSEEPKKEARLTKSLDEESREEVSKINILDMLKLRLHYDPVLVGMIRRLEEFYSQQGIRFHAFDGNDSSENIPLFVSQALAMNQKLLLEVSTVNRPGPNSTRPAHGMILAESKIRGVDMLLLQALRAVLEVHLLLHKMM